MQTSELIEKERQKEKKNIKLERSLKEEKKNIQTKPQYHLKP